jgi:hypothetical protein
MVVTSVLLRFLLANVLSLSGLPATNAATFYDGLQPTTLSPDLSVSATAGFGLELNGSGALFAKPAGTGNGFEFLTTCFAATGDFTVTVQADRTNLGDAQLGLGSYSFESGYPAAQMAAQNPAQYSSGWADAFFLGSSDVASNIWNGGSMPSETVGDGAQSALLRLRRIGDTLYGDYSTDDGLSFTLVNTLSSPSLDGPATFSLFLQQPFGSTDSNQGLFQDLSITADGFVALPTPEPSSVALLAAGAIGLLAYASRRRGRTVLPVSSFLAG